MHAHPFSSFPQQYTKVKTSNICKKTTIRILDQHGLICMQFNVTWLLLTMETQTGEIQSTSSLGIPRISSVARDSDLIENLQYTSLKDIICNTPARYYLTLYEGNEFDSTIAIRNELVKRATSVYLQSAAL